MKVLDPGHLYELKVLDADKEQWTKTVELRFVKREGDKFPGNVGHYPGTNLQEVLRALLNRIAYLDLQEHDDRNLLIAEYTMKAIYLLEQRAAERHGRPTPMIEQACFGETCEKCGHVGCEGTCH